MKTLLKLFIAALSIIGAIAAVFMAAAGIAAYRPHAVEIVYHCDTSPAYSIDTLIVSTWNIGYAAMDSIADFFMDGGKMVRNTEQQMRQNLLCIASALHSNGSDIMLLQEVDIASRRSYYVNQVSVISSYLPDYQSFMSLNFDAFFVPIPLHNPIGRVRSGIAAFTRWQPRSVERWSYPSVEHAPTKWFNLQRCFAVCRYALACGKELVVVNTHNSAFDNGSQRMVEVGYLQEFIAAEYQKNNYVIVGGDWNQTPPQRPLLQGTPQYSPISMPHGFPPQGWSIAADTMHASVRFANQPYSSASLTAVVDFFVLSPNIEVKKTAITPQHFACSDHELVMLTIKLVHPY